MNNETKKEELIKEFVDQKFEEDDEHYSISCPINYNLIRIPAKFANGENIGDTNVYEKSTIVQWVKDNRRSPINSDLVVSTTDLISDETTKGKIDYFIDKITKDFDEDSCYPFKKRDIKDWWESEVKLEAEKLKPKKLATKLKLFIKELLNFIQDKNFQLFLFSLAVAFFVLPPDSEYRFPIILSLFVIRLVMHHYIPNTPLHIRDAIDIFCLAYSAVVLKDYFFQAPTPTLSQDFKSGDFSSQQNTICQINEVPSSFLPLCKL